MTMKKVRKKKTKTVRGCVKRSVDRRARHTSLLVELRPLAQTINAMLNTAEVFDRKADDKRLTAAISLEKARKLCKGSGLGFRGWVDDNVKQGYNECLKLVRIGAAKNPAKALADMRAGVAGRNRVLRKKRDVKVAEADKARALSPYEGAEQGLAILPDKDVLELMEGKARSLGYRVLSEADAEAVKQVARDQADGEFVTIGEVMTAFHTLTARDKGEFVKWAAENIGVTVSDPFQEDHHASDDPIPKNFRRAKGNRGNARDATGA